MSRKPRSCPGCHRDRRTCWVLPCLYLEIIKRRGVRAVASWIRAGLGAPKDALTVERRVS